MLRLSKTIAVVLVVTGAIAEQAQAQPSDSPVYARQRSGIQGGAAWYGGYRPPVRPPFDQFGYGYFGYPPIVAGSWYQRPYPYHFDYYQYRWNTPQPALDCPCELPSRQ